MKYVPDKTGRFRERPHYLPAELDDECEAIITTFMLERCGGLTLPIPTELLTKLIERDAEYLDLYADLSGEEGSNVHGITDFCTGKKPCVRIAKELSEQNWSDHRLRTTLTHEYGHVKFHDPIYQMAQLSRGLFPDAFDRKPLKCKRDDMLNAPVSDWMEWQAGYICGALLMPISHVKRLTAEHIRQYHLYTPLNACSSDASKLVHKLIEAFDVSEEAARIRLLKLGCLVNGDVSQNLFT